MADATGAPVTRGAPTNPEPPPVAAAHHAAARHRAALAASLDLTERSRRAYAPALDRPGLRDALRDLGLEQRLNTLLRLNGTRGVERAAHEMLDLYAAGATLADLLRLGAFLDEVAHDLHVGAAREGRDVLERAEAAADVREDLLQVEGLLARAAGCETPAHLLARSDALLAQATTATALAGRLAFDARRLERAAVLA